MLDIQPGRADFLTESQALERWLREPDVEPGARPRVADGGGGGAGADDRLGGRRGGERRLGWLAGIVRRGDLPQKLLVLHQFTADMIERPERLSRPRGLSMVVNVDGFGTRDQKVAKYREFVTAGFRDGFKLFYREDTGLMTPRQVMALRPRPDLIVYE